MAGVLLLDLDSDESREQTSKTVRSMYLGERCKFCGKEYKELADLEDTVWAGSHEHGRLACKACWEGREEA